MMTNRTNSDPT